MNFIETPNLPKKSVTSALISGQAHEDILGALQNLNLNVITTEACAQLSAPVASHADLLYHHLGGNQMLTTVPNSDASKRMESLGFEMMSTIRNPGASYPDDVLLDAARVGSRLFCYPDHTDQALKEYCERNRIKTIPVKQGYAKCSICVVDEQSIITADDGIARAAAAYGLSVLKITAGHIELPGLDYGFIGGCCGKIAPDCIAFTGDLNTHPDSDRIIQFLFERAVHVLSLHNGPLIDIGGIIPLTTE